MQHSPTRNRIQYTGKHHAVLYKWENYQKQAFGAAINFLEKILSVDTAYFSAELSIL